MKNPHVSKGLKRISSMPREGAQVNLCAIVITYRPWAKTYIPSPKQCITNNSQGIHWQAIYPQLEQNEHRCSLKKASNDIPSACNCKKNPHLFFLDLTKPSTRRVSWIQLQCSMIFTMHVARLIMLLIPVRTGNCKDCYSTDACTYFSREMNIQMPNNDAGAELWYEQPRPTIASNAACSSPASCGIYTTVIISFTSVICTYIRNMTCTLYPISSVSVCSCRTNL